MSTPTERREPQTPPPTAPTQAAWDAMTPEARAAALAQLGPMPDHEASPPEGDWHIEAVRVSEDALDGQFQKRGRGVYIGRGITVYSPEERRFAPDLFVVLDVPTHKRTTWVVSAEQRGLDFVLEVHYGGHRRKDAELNVERYARLGIPEYFMFDARRVLAGARARPGARAAGRLAALVRWDLARPPDPRDEPGAVALSERRAGARRAGRSRSRPGDRPRPGRGGARPSR
jgi:hypothetical protein